MLNINNILIMYNLLHTLYIRVKKKLSFVLYNLL